MLKKIKAPLMIFVLSFHIFVVYLDKNGQSTANVEED